MSKAPNGLGVDQGRVPGFRYHGKSVKNEALANVTNSKPNSSQPRRAEPDYETLGLDSISVGSQHSLASNVSNCSNDSAVTQYGQYDKQHLSTRSIDQKNTAFKNWLIEKSISSALSTSSSTSSSGSVSSLSLAEDRDIFIAKYDYISRVPGKELNLRRGDRVLESPDNDENSHAKGWWKVEYLSQRKAKKRGEPIFEGFVPSNYLVAYMSKYSYQWYFPKTNKTAAKEILNDPINEVGSFLVRRSDSREGEYNLCVKIGTGMKAFGIKKKGGKYLISEKHPSFFTLTELVNHYYDNKRHLNNIQLVEPAKMVEEAPDTHGLTFEPVSEYIVPETSFSLGKVIGKGAFSKVCEAKWNGTISVAVKMLEGGPKVAEAFLKEVETMQELGEHPRLMPLYAIVIKKAAQQFWLVTEFMQNGDLLTHLQNHKPALETKMHYVTQIASGMEFIEEKNFIHNDLAARNVFLTSNNNVKVGDFGLADFVDFDESADKKGSRMAIRWLAPEVLTSAKASIKSDVWSFGILLAEIELNGEAPYKNLSLEQVKKKVGYEKYSMPKSDLPQCQEDLFKWMQKCWQYDPNSRPSFIKLKYELEQMYNNYLN